MLLPTGKTIASNVITSHPDAAELREACSYLHIPLRPYTPAQWVELGGVWLKGYQLRYIYFLDKKCRLRLSVPELPFSAIDEMHAGMYKGQNVTQAERHAIKTPQRNESSSQE